MDVSVMPARLIFKMATIYAIPLQITYVHILAQRKNRDMIFSGYAHFFRVNESNEMDSMAVDNDYHIDFQDDRQLCDCKLHMSIS